jgi:hypothetical protein
MDTEPSRPGNNAVGSRQPGPRPAWSVPPGRCWPGDRLASSPHQAADHPDQHVVHYPHRRVATKVAQPSHGVVHHRTTLSRSGSGEPCHGRRGNAPACPGAQANSAFPPGGNAAPRRTVVWSARVGQTRPRLLLLVSVPARPNGLGGREKPSRRWLAKPLRGLVTVNVRSGVPPPRGLLGGVPRAPAKEEPVMAVEPVVLARVAGRTGAVGPRRFAAGASDVRHCLEHTGGPRATQRPCRKGQGPARARDVPPGPCQSGPPPGAWQGSTASWLGPCRSPVRPKRNRR